MRIIIRALVLFTLMASLFASGCRSTPPLYPKEEQIAALRGGKTAAAAPVLLMDVLNLQEEEDTYEKNLYVGNIEFSGGFVTSPEDGMATRTKNVDFDRQEVLKQRASEVFSRLIDTAVTEKRYEYEKVKLEEIVPVFNPSSVRYTMEIDYSKHKEDGNDNINLPWYILKVQGLSPDLAHTISQSTDAKYLMVPLIEHYYSHSAGWFNDQTYGCGAGIRMTFHVLIFDLESGKRVFHYTNMEKNIDYFTSRFSEFLVIQEFMKIEEKMGKALLKNLPNR
jgi:hypothetical protein